MRAAVFGPNTEPTRMRAATSAGWGGAVTTTSVVSGTAEVRSGVSRAGRGLVGMWDTNARASRNPSSDTGTGRAPPVDRGGEADPGQVHAERRRHRDGALERLGVGLAERPPPGVEDDRGQGPPGRLVLADHELAPAGHAGPVDPAEVVAEHVLPHRVELLGRAEQLPAGRLPGARPVVRRRRLVEVLHLRIHHQVVPLAELHPDL